MPGKGAFIYTDFELLLHIRGIKNLVIAGITIEEYFPSTIRQAAERGFDCLLLTDAIATTNSAQQTCLIETVKAEGGIYGSTGNVQDVVNMLGSLSSSEISPKAPSTENSSTQNAQASDPPNATDTTVGVGLADTSTQQSSLGKGGGSTVTQEQPETAGAPNTLAGGQDANVDPASNTTSLPQAEPGVSKRPEEVPTVMSSDESNTKQPETAPNPPANVPVADDVPTSTQQLGDSSLEPSSANRSSTAPAASITSVPNSKSQQVSLVVSSDSSSSPSKATEDPTHPGQSVDQITETGKPTVNSDDDTSQNESSTKQDTDIIAAFVVPQNGVFKEYNAFKAAQIARLEEEGASGHGKASGPPVMSPDGGVAVAPEMPVAQPASNYAAFRSSITNEGDQPPEGSDVDSAEPVTGDSSTSSKLSIPPEKSTGSAGEADPQPHQMSDSMEPEDRSLHEVPNAKIDEQPLDSKNASNTEVANKQFVSSPVTQDTQRTTDEPSPPTDMPAIQEDGQESRSSEPAASLAEPPPESSSFASAQEATHQVGAASDASKTQVIDQPGVTPDAVPAQTFIEQPSAPSDTQNSQLSSQHLPVQNIPDPAAQTYPTTLSDRAGISSSTAVAPDGASTPPPTTSLGAVDSGPIPSVTSRDQAENDTTRKITDTLAMTDQPQQGSEESSPSVTPNATTAEDNANQKLALTKQLLQPAESNVSVSNSASGQGEVSSATAESSGSAVAATDETTATAMSLSTSTEDSNIAEQNTSSIHADTETGPEDPGSVDGIVTNVSGDKTMSDSLSQEASASIKDPSLANLSPAMPTESYSAYKPTLSMQTDQTPTVEPASTTSTEVQPTAVPMPPSQDMSEFGVPAAADSVVPPTPPAQSHSLFGFPAESMAQTDVMSTIGPIQSFPMESAVPSMPPTQDHSTFGTMNQSMSAPQPGISMIDSTPEPDQTLDSFVVVNQMPSKSPSSSIYRYSLESFTY